MDQMATLKTLCRNVKANVKFGAKAKKLTEWQQSANGYSVKLTFMGRRMTVDFWTGSAHTKEPTSYDVLYCILSDATANDMSFEDFCGDFGYDSDSRNAEKLYNACKRIGVKVRKLLGDDFETFSSVDRE